MNTVLDVGCGTGRTGEWIKTNWKCSWVGGVEPDAKAASAARSRLDTVFQTGIEQLEESPNANGIDVILCLDVLEHLSDPWSVLSKMVRWLTPGGAIIVSCPNVRHYSVVAPLLFLGLWEYSSWGVLDRTHLRFFTRKGVIAMLEGAGLTVDKVLSTGLERGSKAALLNAMTFGLFRPFLEFQYLARGSRG